MIRRCLCFISLLVCGPLVFAHDIGFAEAKITQISEFSYQFAIEKSPTVENNVTAPVLPQRCQFSSQDQSLSESLIYSFECADKPLSAEDAFILPWRREAVLMAYELKGEEQTQSLFLKEGEVIVVHMRELIGSSWLYSAKRYTLLGFDHILEGFDHLMFVLALMLLINNGMLLLKAVTAFTVAHSITLALSFLGFIKLPSAPVEASIAFSIVILAYEYLLYKKGKVGLTVNYPWLIAGSFGLLHGLGFAGALAEIGVAKNEIPIALLFFNIGVELGQIVFIAFVLVVAFVVVRAARQLLKLNNPVETIKTAFAYAIGGVAMFWTLERAENILNIFA